jgi:hypothetical protein
MKRNLSSGNDPTRLRTSFFILLVGFIALAGGCRGKGGKTVIEGSFPFAMKQKVICFHMNSSTLEPVDSTVTDDKGRFRFSFHAGNPEFYSIRFDENKKNIVLAVHPGEKITITSPVKEYWKNYNVRGSEDSEKVSELVRNQELYRKISECWQKPFMIVYTVRILPMLLSPGLIRLIAGLLPRRKLLRGILSEKTVPTWPD